MAQTTMTAKDVFLQTWDRETETTLRVLRAYPTGRDDFKPAEKSGTTRELVWTLVLGQKFAMAACQGPLDFTQGIPPAPQAPVSDLAHQLEQVHREAAATVQKLSDADLDRTIAFPTGPGKMGEIRLRDFLWMTVMDMVHHRGQFSVYLRMVGAKVPSIYGPTADEPWM